MGLILFDCSKCKKKFPLRDGYIIKQPKKPPLKFCCKKCFSQALESL